MNKLIKHPVLVEKGEFTVDYAAAKELRVITYDVPNKLEEGKAKQAIWCQNSNIGEDLTPEDSGKGFTLRFKVGERDQSITNWVAVASLGIRNSLGQVDFI